MRNGPFQVLLSTVVMVTSFALGGCSGADHPTASEGSTTADPSAAPQTDPNAAAAPACSEEGATIRCAQLGERSGQYVSCGKGTRTCTGGAWSACTAPEGESDWYPATAPCDPCDTAGETRACKILLGDQGKVKACFQGKETCTGGYWSNCL